MAHTMAHTVAHAALARLAPARWPKGVVVVLGLLFLHPLDETGQRGLRLQGRPCGELTGQLFFSQACVYFAVANAVQSSGYFAALAFGHHMVRVYTGPRYQGPAAQRAVAQGHAGVAQRQAVAQRALSDHG